MANGPRRAFAVTLLGDRTAGTWKASWAAPTILLRTVAARYCYYGVPTVVMHHRPEDEDDDGRQGSHRRRERVGNLNVVDSGPFVGNQLQMPRSRPNGGRNCIDSM